MPRQSGRSCVNHCASTAKRAAGVRELPPRRPVDGGGMKVGYRGRQAHRASWRKRDALAGG
ncbi:hypothetical protein LNQ52_25710 [Klebsiella pneumoniae subsp. pneumoniae]|nr:hypothetical protein [Klebsiella pneumoniae subsp. pneumoniae]